MTKEEFLAKTEAEKEMLFYKTMQCPVCSSTVKWRTIKSGKLRAISTDSDMRTIYHGIDPNKYHVVSCHQCGYTSLERNFTSMPSVYVKRIEEQITANFQPTEGDPEVITYSQAFERYRMALSCATAKNAKASDTAYLFLKTAWILRGEREELDLLGNTSHDDNLLAKEKLFLKKAYDQFITARQTEDFPMCGMDEGTLDYLIASLAVDQGDYAAASKLLSSVITSFSAAPKLKDKARELKEKISSEKQS